MCDILGGLVRDKHFHDHLAGLDFAGFVSCDNHASGRFADTRCGQRTLAFNRDHARAAVAIRPVAWFWFVAQMWDD